MGEEVTPTLISRYESAIGNTQDKLNVICLNDQGGQQMAVTENQTGTIRAQEHGHQPIVLENHPADSRVKVSEDGIVQTLSSRMGTGGGNTPMVAEVMNKPNTEEEYTGDYVVRRLTPMECERLQGYPDHWTDIGEWVDSKGKKHKDADSPRYKALGNSIALPFWEWMAKRMVPYIKGHEPTMASLFDGIGGFPLVFTRAGCKPLWASEIEEFPIAVTKYHFKENEDEMR